MSRLIQLGLSELVLFVLTLFAGTTWWQLQKRQAFLKRILANQDDLDVVISPSFLLNPAPEALLYATKSPLGYSLNLSSLVRGDQFSQQRPRWICLLVLLLAASGSLYAGILFVVINLSLFCLLGLVPISSSARRNALEHVITVAVVVFRWHSENPSECEELISRSGALAKLYNTVKRIGSTLSSR